MRWLNGITDSMDMSLSELWELVIRQGSLACCSPWGRKDSDTTERLTGPTSANKAGVGCRAIWLKPDLFLEDWTGRLVI